MHSPSDLSVAQAVCSRKSVRAFLDQDVPRALLEEVLTVAARAPSGGNLQPWRLRVLSGEAMAAFKSVMRSRVREAPDGEDPPRVAEDVRVLDQPELAERRTAERRSVFRGRDDLSQVSEKERRHDRAQSVRPGTRSPCSRAASSASS